MRNIPRFKHVIFGVHVRTVRTSRLRLIGATCAVRAETCPCRFTTGADVSATAGEHPSTTPARSDTRVRTPGLAMVAADKTTPDAAATGAGWLAAGRSGGWQRRRPTRTVNTSSQARPERPARGIGLMISRYRGETKTDRAARKGLHLSVGKGEGRPFPWARRHTLIGGRMASLWADSRLTAERASDRHKVLPRHRETPASEAERPRG
jgi:hypothetical protein